MQFVEILFEVFAFLETYALRNINELIEPIKIKERHRKIMDLKKRL